MKNVMIAFLPALVLCACAGKDKLESTQYLSVVGKGDLPPPTRLDLSQLTTEYVIGPSDRITVDVFGLAELSRTVVVDASGSVSLPLAGRVKVSGVTPPEAETIIAQAYRSHAVRNPQVSVNLTEAVSQIVTVDGEVGKPGTFPMVGRLTLLRAISRAEGLTEFAKLSHVVVIREVDGKRYAALYDVRAIRQGFYLDPEIYANDVILVGTSQSRRIFKDLVAISPLLTAPLIALLPKL